MKIIVIIASILLSLIIAGAGAYWHFSRVTYYTGPVSDHFDGERFFYPYFERKREKGDFWKWQRERDRQEWPSWIEIPTQDTPPARVEGDAIRVAFVNHMTTLIQTGGLNILTDPIWSERASPVSFAGPKRIKDPGIAFDNLPPIDYVTISHSHYEHMDMPTIKRLWQRFDPVFIVPLGNDTLIKSIDPSIKTVAMDWYEKHELTNGFTVHTWPAQHWSKRTFFDTNKALWGSFIIERPGLKPLYIAGDMGYGEGYPEKKAGEEFGPFKLALIPYGTYEPRWFMSYSHMNPEEAVKTMQNLKADYAIGTHHGTFQLSDESYERPFADLAQALKEASVPEGRFKALENGDVWVIE